MFMKKPNINVHSMAIGSMPCRPHPVEPAFDDIAIGIRETVRTLWRAGFHPCSWSNGETTDGPHVFMTVLDRDDIVRETDRLRLVMARHGAYVTPCGNTPADATIEASYDSATGLALIWVVGVDDKRLGLAEAGG